MQVQIPGLLHSARQLIVWPALAGTIWTVLRHTPCPEVVEPDPGIAAIRWDNSIAHESARCGLSKVEPFATTVH